MRRLFSGRSLALNTVSLMTATIATNALGLVFWAEAAHLLSPAQIGRGAAVVASLTLLATLAQLNLTTVFMRLLPGAGHLGRRLVLIGYLAVLGAAVLFGVGFELSGFGSGFLPDELAVRVGFVAGVVVLSVFALQDSVLIALRRSPLVAVENVSFAIAKLLALPAMAALPAATGVGLAWVAPAALAVAVVSIVVFRRLLPAHGAQPGVLPPRRRLLSLIAGEYTNSVLATATAQVMPLVVVWRLGPTAAAYFMLPWLISMGITLLLWNVASTFVVEVASGRPEAQPLRQSVLMWGAVVLGALIICTLGAAPLLGLAGAGYAAHGATLLRLIGLSAPFSAITTLYLTFVWLDQRVWVLALIQGGTGAAVVGASTMLLPTLGVAAAGWANLAAYALAAAICAPLAMRRLRHREPIGAL